MRWSSSFREIHRSFEQREQTPSASERLFPDTSRPTHLLNSQSVVTSILSLFVLHSLRSLASLRETVAPSNRLIQGKTNEISFVQRRQEPHSSQKKHWDNEPFLTAIPTRAGN